MLEPTGGGMNVFEVKVRRGLESKYDNQWWTGRIKVYDIKYGSCDNDINFLIFDPMWNHWKFVPASDFEPIE